MGNDEKFNHYTRLSRESNTKPTEYKTEALLQLEPACSLAALPLIRLLDQDLSLILRSFSGTASLTKLRFVIPESSDCRGQVGAKILRIFSHIEGMTLFS
jgi:hypothetical protein